MRGRMMNPSTKDVTLYSGFIFDVLSEYRAMERVCRPAFEMARHLDPNDPLHLAPISTYNAICDWIEKNVGVASIRDAGRAIGARVYARMVKDAKLGSAPPPSAILHELRRVASVMIQDPLHRGWEIVEDLPRRIVIRRTQTFNCMLQEGLLLALVEKTSVLMPAARHLRCTRAGAPYCDYEVTWIERGGSAAR